MDEIKAQGALFFLAGYDTTANALCWLIYSLACNPDVQEKVYDEIQNQIGDEVRIRIMLISSISVCGLYRWYENVTMYLSFLTL